MPMGLSTVANVSQLNTPMPAPTRYDDQTFMRNGFMRLCVQVLSKMLMRLVASAAEKSSFVWQFIDPETWRLIWGLHPKLNFFV